MTAQSVSLPAAQPATSPIATLEHACVRLGQREVLHDVSATLCPGEFLGVIGSNGAGKTTLLRLLLGLVPVYGGTVRILGDPPHRGSRAIGYVPQQGGLDPDLPLRARDFVGLGLDGDRWGMGRPDRARDRRIDEALDAVGASSYATAPVGRLSGGEQQRLYLAQALVGEPRLLLLDEPLANLDLRSRRDVVNLVRGVSRDRDIGVVLVAHDINPLLGAVDRVLYLANGLGITGTVDEVIRGDVLSRLYGFPVDVIRAAGHVLVVGAGESDDCHA
jgi:zinc/manganese transport system ATP-binding protein